MTTGINFWDGSIWTFVTTLTILLIAMLAAAILRHAFPAIRKLMIPSSVLGGFLILLIGFLTRNLALMRTTVSATCTSAWKATLARPKLRPRRRR